MMEFTRGRWTHKYFRDVEFELNWQMPQSRAAIYVGGWWIRKDFGCGELCLNWDTLLIKDTQFKNWRKIDE